MSRLESNLTTVAFDVVAELASSMPSQFLSAGIKLLPAIIKATNSGTTLIRRELICADSSASFFIFCACIVSVAMIPERCTCWLLAFAFTQFNPVPS